MCVDRTGLLRIAESLQRSRRLLLVELWVLLKVLYAVDDQSRYCGEVTDCLSLIYNAVLKLCVNFCSFST